MHTGLAIGNSYTAAYHAAGNLTRRAPTSTTSDLYDGKGDQVQQCLASGATTTVTYLSNLEELSTTDGSFSTTTYYYSRGQRVAEADNGAFSCVGGDGGGSAEEALEASVHAAGQSLVVYQMGA